MDHELQISEKLLTGLSEGQRELLNQGIFLVQIMADDHPHDFADYSFVVFPFAKCYEGFLKQVFFDVGFIRQEDYVGTHFRLGKVLSPALAKRLGNRSVYAKICNNDKWCSLADEIWNAWKVGRNQVFHYFPHNLQSLQLVEAIKIVNMLLITMDKVLAIEPHGQQKAQIVR